MHKYDTVFYSETESVVDVNVQMDRLTIPENIESVQVFTDLNNWDVKDALSMKYSQKEERWYLPEEVTAEKPFTQYYLVFNGRERTHITNKPTGKPNTWANYATIRKPNEKRIIFDESEYKQGKPEHIITGAGADMDYHQLCETFTGITNDLTGSYHVRDLDELQRYMTTYKQYSAMMDSLKKLYEHNHSWAFTDQECRMIELHHQNAAKRIPGAANNTEFRSRFANLDIVREMAILLKDVKNNDLELSNFLVNHMMSIDYDLESCYLYEELKEIFDT